MEATQTPDAEFKTMVIRIVKDLREKVDDLSENLNKQRESINKDIKTTKKNQSGMKNTIPEKKSSLEGINSSYMKQRVKSVNQRTRKQYLP